MRKFFVDLFMNMFGLFLSNSKPKVEEGAGSGKEEKKLREKVKKDGW